MTRAMRWLALACALARGAFVLPKEFEGNLTGRPSVSILGPWSENMTFTIARASNGDYLMEDRIRYDVDKGVATPGWQRYYVEGSGPTAGLLWYCGHLTNFLPNRSADTSPVAMPLNRSGTTAAGLAFVEFCLDAAAEPHYVPAGNRGCSAFRWRFEMLGPDQFRSTMVTYGETTHLGVDFARVGAAPAVTELMPGHGAAFRCNYSLPPPWGAAAAPRRQGCPFRQAARGVGPGPRAGRRAPRRPGSAYDQCFVLNRNLNFELEWTLDELRGLAHVRVSADVSADSYIALGWKPESLLTDKQGDLLGMKGADMVLGFDGCPPRTLHADLYAGAPSETSGEQHITNASMTRAGGTLRLAFTRPIVDGAARISLVGPAVGDVVWAVGPGALDTTSNTPCGQRITYHGAYRGLRFVSWRNEDWASQGFYQCKPVALSEELFTI